MRYAAFSFVGLKVLLIPAVLLVVAGCGAHDVRVPSERAREPLEVALPYRVGAARINITPLDGGRLARTGERAVGSWSSLYARAIWIDQLPDASPNGQNSTCARRAVLVACDIPSISSALADEVAANLKSDVSRSEIMLGATGNLGGPDGLGTAPRTNLRGFDPVRLKWIAKQIGVAVRCARDHADPATVSLAYGRVDPVARIDGSNVGMSSGPMLKNDRPLIFINNDLDALSIIELEDALHVPRFTSTRPASGAFDGSPWMLKNLAVDNRVPALCFRAGRDRDRPGKVIAIAAFAPFRDASPGPNAPVWSPSTLGLASAFAEAALTPESADSVAGEQSVLRCENKFPVVAFFAGAGSDVSAVQRLRESRDGMLELARALASASIEGVSRGRPEYLGFVDARAAMFSTNRNKDVELEGGRACRDAPRVTPVRDGWPTEARTGVFRIGPALLVAVPGNVSTMLGMHARQRATAAFVSSPPCVDDTVQPPEPIVVGLAGGDLGSFSTANEDRAMHNNFRGRSPAREGINASAENALLDNVHLLVSGLAEAQDAAPSRTNRYPFGAEALRSIPPAVLRLKTTANVADEWFGKFPNLRPFDFQTSNSEDGQNIGIMVQRRVDGEWETLARSPSDTPATSGEFDLLRVRIGANPKLERWHVLWSPSHDVPASSLDCYRLTVERKVSPP